MKHLHLICLFLLLGLVGCSNDDEPEIPANLWDWDCGPYVLYIDIEDTDGNSLFADGYHGIVGLDDDTPDFTYTYAGETKPVGYFYSPVDAVRQPESRAYPTIFYGVSVIRSYFQDQHPQICFGEFDGPEDHHESVILNWPDGTHSTIELTARAVKFYEPNFYMRIRVDDGQWQEAKSSATLTFVK